jgi:hypothetical protein
MHPWQLPFEVHERETLLQPTAEVERHTSRHVTALARRGVGADQSFQQRALVASGRASPVPAIRRFTAPRRTFNETGWVAAMSTPFNLNPA